MNALFLSDTQIGAGKNLAADRLADQEQGLNEIADLADAYDVELVVHCGDVFDSRHPDEDSRMVFKRFARRIEASRQFVVVAGNHDLRNAAVASAVDLYDECEFVREPDVVQFTDANFACLPWTPPGRMVASQNGGDRDEIHALIADRLVDVARDLRERCPDTAPAILVPHWWISGATTVRGVGSPDVIREPQIPLNDLTALGYDAIVAGHVHNPEPLSLAPLVAYCGSPMVCDWGETGMPHGVRVLDTTTMEHRFIEIPDHPFVTVDADLTGSLPLYDTDAPLDETDYISAAIAERFPLTDAVVRIRYRATAEQARRVDHAALRGLVADAGASKLYAIQPEIVRSERARVEGVDENLSEREALIRWTEANGIGGPQEEALDSLTADYLEALA